MRGQRQRQEVLRARKMISDGGFKADEVIRAQGQVAATYDPSGGQGLRLDGW